VRTEITTKRGATRSVFLTKYYSSDQIKKNGIDEACSTYGGEDGRRQDLGGGPEWKTPLGRPKSRWKDNIKIDLQEVECGDMD
jgi:hypothetical protein